ncbi:hypothetical protein [Egbenema bharatensis]|uniref:hypothetical protein n=1 Tax=Egbenema bharatensis TaxID=3463334 RepID=UPI003A8A43B0
MLTGQALRGRYEILGKLGEGAFGETYKARDLEKLSKPFCVVKQLKPAHTNQLVRDFFLPESTANERSTWEERSTAPARWFLEQRPQDLSFCGSYLALTALSVRHRLSGCSVCQDFITLYTF